VRVKVLYFASLKARAGLTAETVDLPSTATVAELKQQLADRHAGLGAALPTVLVAVNREFAFPGDGLAEGDEVALFPPVSGGGDQAGPTFFLVTENVLDMNNLLAQLVRPTTGAACVFTGVVRGETLRGEAHQTEALEYEAYVPMAEAKMHQVADEIRQRWPAVEGIGIVQRVGHLAASTPTVVIACTAAHRDMGVFEAARYGIDRLKEIVPIWKKEIGPDGEEWVEGKYIPSERDKQS
jgi:molybdopterin converting factor subunit 1